MSGWHHKKILLIATVILSAGLLSLHKYDDPDYYFHVASGRYIATRIASHAFVQKYPFTFTYNRPWLDHEWLSQLIIYGFERLFGKKWGPFGFTFLFLSLAMALSLLTAWEAGAKVRAGPLLAVLLLLPSRQFISPRPYLIGISLAAASLLLLERLKNHKSAPWPVFMLIASMWANSHGSFPAALGFAVAFLFTRDRASRKGAAWAALAIVLGFLVNPYFWHVLLVPVQHFKAAIVTTFPGPEWSPWAFGNNPWMDLLFLLVFVVSLVPFVRSDASDFLPEFIVVAFYLVLAIKAQRFAFNATLLAVPLALGIMRPIHIMRYIAPIAAALGVTVALLMVPAAKQWVGLDQRNFPVSAVRVCKSIPKKGAIRVFNPLYAGGYIEYTGFPGLKPAIDGQVYVSGFREVGWYINLLKHPESFVSKIKRLRVDCVMVDSTSPMFFPAINALAGSDEYLLAHIDDHFGVYVRSDDLPGKAKIFKVLRPLSTPGYLLHLTQNQVRTARQEARSLLKQAPVYANLCLGVLALNGCIRDLSPLSLGRRRQCNSAPLPFFNKLVRLRPSTGLFRYLKAGVLQMLGRTREALQELKACPDYPACRALKIVIEKTKLPD